MKQRILLASGVALAIIIGTGTHLRAQSDRRSAAYNLRQQAVSQRGQRRSDPARAAAYAKGAPAAKAQVSALAKSSVLYLVFDYDLTRGPVLDLDDDGTFTSPGDRNYLEADVYQSNSNAAKFSKIGTVVIAEDLLESDRANTGTDRIHTVNMALNGEGQIRAGGFWNVSSGVGDPALPVLGATGTSYLRRFGSGQLIFLGQLPNDEEHYVLIR